MKPARAGGARQAAQPVAERTETPRIARGESESVEFPVDAAVELDGLLEEPAAGLAPGQVRVRRHAGVGGEVPAQERLGVCEM